MRKLFFSIVACVLLIACGGQHSPQSWAERLLDTPLPDSIAFRYARLIHVEQADGYRVVYIDNPWKPGKPLHTYVLVPHDAALPHSLPGGTVVRTPLRRSVVFTSVHCALIGLLRAEERVAGVADLKYIKVPYVQEGVANGSIADCGEGMSPLVERIIDAGADGLLLSPFENSGGYGRLEDIGIPIVECAEYMEQSPLARAEWMRFYGMLYGEEALADSMFLEVEANYLRLKHQAAMSSQHPEVLVDKMAGGVWYVPGGRSTIGQMLSDAGGVYPWVHDGQSGSLQLSFETVLERAGQSDVWLLRYDSDKPLTMGRLLSENEGYAMMKPVKTQSVFACNVSTSMFYEETPFRPDLLLEDFIHILHPDTLNSRSLRYYHKVRSEE
ncbi:MAG: ABC transporter substrate-binding protein [Prevotella sp.]|nr:ABC transporter substrate-binding protein [Prevotella sp.]